ncbi:MAG: hypothetical protein LBP90_00005, partial [Burkholderiales bacterium]|nr:hypothetical protein [Burkholderiales bacterium]
MGLVSVAPTGRTATTITVNASMTTNTATNRFIGGANGGNATAQFIAPMVALGVVGNISTGDPGSYGNGGVRPVPLDCDSLYGSNNQNVWRINLGANGQASAPVTVLWDWNNRGSAALGMPGATNNRLSSLALGRYPAGGASDPFNHPDAKLNLYAWGWNVPTSSTVGWMYRVPEDETSRAYVVTSSLPQPLRVPPATTSTGNAYWSGGEVNQRTGEIYLTGGENNALDGDFRMMIYNPATNKWRQSGLIKPKTPSDGPFASGNIASAGYVSSDMAIDANGNAYTLIGSSTKWLVRIVPGTNENGGDWTYNRVVRLSGASGLVGSGNVWGMAFLNGMLYGINGENLLFSINPMSGVVTQVGSGSAVAPNDTARDLASCQVAAVIQGVVYNDTSGTGNVVPGVTEGVEGIAVDIYKEENGVKVYRGSRTTDGSGNYSFIVDSPSATYYIRVRQPKIGGTAFDTEDVNIGGINAAQTWVGTGGTENVSTAYCVDDAGVRQTMSAAYEGVCRGVRLFGSDPVGPATLGTAWANFENEAQIYAKVVMTTDQEVVDVDFGISATANFGDAPEGAGSNFRTLFNNGGPFHVIANNWLHLGATNSAQTNGQPQAGANAIASDDGVFVVLHGVEVPLQNIALADNRTYTFKAKVNGLLSD